MAMALSSCILKTILVKVDSNLLFLLVEKCLLAKFARPIWSKYLLNLKVLTTLCFSTCIPWHILQSKERTDYFFLDVSIELISSRLSCTKSEIRDDLHNLSTSKVSVLNLLVWGDYYQAITVKEYFEIRLCHSL